MAIKWGFWMSFLNFARATLAQVAFYLKMWVLLLVSYTMFAINIAILIILFVMMQLWRWEHSGRVCSGDYLDQITEEDRSRYLVVEGLFIKWVLYIVYIIFGLAALTMCILVCCYSGPSNRGSNRLSRQQTSAFDAPIDQHFAEARYEAKESEMKKARLRFSES